MTSLTTHEVSASGTHAPVAHTGKKLRHLAIILVALAATACASAADIPSQPFVDFEQSIAQLKVSSDGALAKEQEIVYERYLEQWRATGNIEDLQLQTSGPFMMQPESAILFKQIEDARSKLADMNSVVLQYAGTLIMLTGVAEGSTTIDADAVATELRSSASALATRLGADATLSDGYFFGFGVLAKNFLETKREDALTELILSSQAEIEAFAGAAQQLCKASGLGIQAEYLSTYSKLTASAADLSEIQRGDLIVSILALNEETLRQLDTLRLVHDAYGALPAAHRNLAEAAKNSVSFIELLSYAESLKKRYEAFSEE